MDALLLEDITSFYNLHIQQITPIDGGWLNEKYLLECREGKYLLKIFSMQRFNEDKIKQIENSCTLQIKIQDFIICPKILKVSMRYFKEYHYQIMSYIQGEQKNSSSITLEELVDLGRNIQLLHTTLKQQPSQEHIKGEDFLNQIQAYHQKYKHQLPIEISAQQARILKTLTPSYFDSLSQGLCHEDLGYDNILFYQGKVSAILDFDRVCQSYYVHDIGRVILSFCFEKDHLNLDKVIAFANGYQLDSKKILDALKITWCIESAWWIIPKMLENNEGKPAIFKEELLWLTNHYFELENILKSVL